MPAIRHSSKRKAPPQGYSDIEDSLLVYSNKMKDAIAAPPPNGPRHQATWEITQINHQRSKYVWDMYCEEKISKALYDWCVKNGQCDATLVAKWKKEGYEKFAFEEEMAKNLMRKEESTFKLPGRVVKIGIAAKTDGEVKSPFNKDKTILV
ncbi:Component of the SF3b subcomplex of the U2 snRNP [Ciborinia camelliae]|nr:Component of the SF3b subcomplex of the U2 snRNP [Ciborinia camelliae]